MFSSCSHAGIINVCRHVRSLSLASGTPLALAGVMGGFHLAGRDVESRIDATVRDLVHEMGGAEGKGVVLGGHCTGWRAKAALASALKGRFQPVSVGGRYEWAAPV